jgi:hypothetical protein
MAEKVIEIRKPEERGIRYGSAAISLFVALFAVMLVALVWSAIKVSPPQTGVAIEQPRIGGTLKTPAP